jgi:CMP-2-keto-3-deoxyoctulosonic acid synthetase
MRIKVGLTVKDTIGVDTNEDLERVIKYMSNRGA